MNLGRPSFACKQKGDLMCWAAAFQSQVVTGPGPSVKCLNISLKAEPSPLRWQLNGNDMTSEVESGA